MTVKHSSTHTHTHTKPNRETVTILIICKKGQTINRKLEQVPPKKHTHTTPPVRIQKKYISLSSFKGKY